MKILNKYNKDEIPVEFVTMNIRVDIVVKRDNDIWKFNEHLKSEGNNQLCLILDEITECISEAYIIDGKTPDEVIEMMNKIKKKYGNHNIKFYDKDCDEEDPNSLNIQITREKTYKEFKQHFDAELMKRFRQEEEAKRNLEYRRKQYESLKKEFETEK